MKISKTLVFIASNPLSLIVPLFGSWVSFSALATLSDDPFIYGTLPDIVEAASIQTALALIIGAIIDDFAYHVYWIAIPAALLISFWGARSYAKGIAKERQLWMPWYHQQQNAIAQGNILEEPPTASENIRNNAYFRKTQSVLLHLIRPLTFFVIHFSCWFSAFALLVIIMQPSNGIVESAHYLVKSFPDIAILAAIHAFLSCYQEARGSTKGTVTERQTWMKWYDMWMKWYQRQQEAKTLGYVLDEASPLLNVG